MVLFDLSVFIIACIILIVSSFAVVKALEIMASFLRLSEFVVGFILIGISTSLPELFVGISSGIAKTPALTLGNVIGANILDLTIVLGIIVVFARSIKYEHKTLSRDSWIMLGAASIAMALAVIGQKLSRLDGVILLVLFFVYLYHLISERKVFSKEMENGIGRYAVVASTLIFAAAIAALIYSAGLIVKFGSRLAVEFALPPLFIGIFLISFGTTLPELFTGLMSIKQRHPEFALGDIAGSIISNSLLVLGVTAIICPITSSFFLLMTSASFMLMACFFFVAFTEAGKKFIWQEGVAMILMYIFFVIIELNLKGFF